MFSIKKPILIVLSLIVLFSIKGLYFLDNKNISLKEFSKEFIKDHLHFDGPAQFAKIHNHIRVRNDHELPKYKMGYILKEFNKAKEFLQYRDSKKLNWIERGPANVGGRTRGLIVDPDDTTHQTFYAGSVGGGVWRTSDGGNTWENLTEDLPNLATSTLAMSKHNTDVIYAGTGEGFDGLMVNGSGVWKSIDRGETWEVLSSTYNDERFLNVMRLIVNPDDENEILACTRGRKDFKSFVLKSKDGGQTWEQKYLSQGQSIQQLVYTPGDFSVMYASILRDGIIKSTDSGETWKKVFNSKTKGIGRIEMAVSPVNHGNVFLSCEHDSGAQLYFSKDSMKTATKVLLQGTANWLGEQGWYDNAIAAHPYDTNKVWVAGSGPILEINVGKDEREINTLKEFKNNTDFLVDIKTNISFDGDGLAGDFARQFQLNPNTSEDDLVDVEIRFGKDKKQKAHLLNLNFSTYQLSFDKMIEVPFEAWDLKNNKQIGLTIVDLDANGQWTFKDYTLDQFAFPDIVLVNMFDYTEESNDMISSGNNVVNKAQYYFYKGKKPNFQGSIDSLPEGNLLFKTGIIKGLLAEFDPITDGYGEYSGISSVGSKGVHVDHHNLLFIPVDTATKSFYVLNANDGGVAFSKDNGKTFKQTGDTFAESAGAGNTTSDGYNVSQFYGADKMNGADRYIGGTQDNGSWVSPINPDTKTKWKSAPSGDGFEAAWNYGNPKLVLESSQYNNIYKSTDGGQTWNYVNLPESFGPFLTRIASSQIDPDLVFVSSDTGLIKSTDFGSTWTIKTMPYSWEFSFFGPPIKISLADANIVWSGSAITNYSRIALSKDKGETWEETAAYDKVDMGNVTGLATHPIDNSTAYVLFSQANGPKILRTTDFGNSWIDISGFEIDGVEKSKNGFPNVATYSLLVMPFDTNIIWAGTEIGLFESIDNGKSWHYADNGLPAVGIWQMKIVNNQIVLATHGRGIWTLDVEEIVTTNNPEENNIGFNIYPNPVSKKSFIDFNVNSITRVDISLYSLDGKKLKNIVNRNMQGKQKIAFDRDNLLPGIYILTLKTMHGTSSKKIIVQ